MQIVYVSHARRAPQSIRDRREVDPLRDAFKKNIDRFLEQRPCPR